MKPQPKLECTAVVGGTKIQVREKSSSLYLNFELLESHSGWKEKWFYIGDHDPKLRKVSGHHPEWNSRWIDKPTHRDSLQVLEVLAKITHLKEQGLTGAGMAFNFLEETSATPAAPLHVGLRVLGPQRPIKMTFEESSDDRERARLKLFFKNANEIPQVVPEFSAANPLRAVSTRGFSPRVLI